MYSDKVTSTYASIQRTKRLSGLKILTRLIDPEYLKRSHCYTHYFELGQEMLLCLYLVLQG